MITAEQIEHAYKKIHSSIRHTPLLRSEVFERKIGAKFPVYFKLENLQLTGSFKSRGALNKLLSVEGTAKKKGVITASAGNHAQGVAYHAQRLGIHAKIVMPETTPLVKVNSTKQWGAEIVFFGESYQEAFEKAKEIQASEGREYIHAFDDNDVIAGQGTIALEVLRDCPDVGVFLAPIGGGGLLSGCAVYMQAKKPDCKMLAVQATGSSTFIPSLEKGSPITLPTVSTIAEGMACKRMGDLTFEVCKNTVKKTILVDDEEISQGILWLLENERVFAEGCGGASVAALIKNPEVVTAPTVVVVSGGNLDVNLLARIIERGLVKSGRLAMVDVQIPDAPGSLHKLIQTFAELKASIVQIHHERVFAQSSLKEVYTTISLETQGSDHVERIREALQSKGWRARFH